MPPEGKAGRFKQGFQTLQRRDEVEASGIGLAIVKKIVEAQGGRIWLRSPIRDRGTAFHFTVPLD